MPKRFPTIIAIALVTTSCSRGVSNLRTMPLTRQNPTSWKFPFPVSDFRDQALTVLSIDHQAADHIFPKPSGNVLFESTLFPESSTNAVFSEAIFRNPANTNDIYLHPMGNPFTVSSVYYGRKGGLPFIAAFHLHLTPADEGSNTLVNITALDTQVINGEKFGGGSCGPGYAWNFQSVPPTTVEEYTILHYLGRGLGITNMPAVVSPSVPQ